MNARFDGSAVCNDFYTVQVHRKLQFMSWLSLLVCYIYLVCICRQGTAVFWNVPADEQLNFLKMLQEYEDNPYDRMMVNDESDSLEYKYVP